VSDQKPGKANKSGKGGIWICEYARGGYVKDSMRNCNRFTPHPTKTNFCDYLHLPSRSCFASWDEKYKEDDD
jgi:hypothetical protein